MPRANHSTREGRSKRSNRSTAAVRSIRFEASTNVAHRDVIEADGSCTLGELDETYGLKFAAENKALRSENTFFRDETVDEALT